MSVANRVVGYSGSVLCILYKQTATHIDQHSASVELCVSQCVLMIRKLTWW